METSQNCIGHAAVDFLKYKLGLWYDLGMGLGLWIGSIVDLGISAYYSRHPM